MASLCERLGGQAAVAAVVNKFYDFMLADQRVAGFFKNTNMEKQRERQTQFIILATGGPNKYEGKDMKQAHLNMGIGDVEFDATWENLEKALNEFNVKKDYINELKEIFYSVKDDIVIKK